MNRAFLPVLKSIGIAILAMSSLASVAYANEGAKSAKADPAKGEALFTNGDAARGIVACVSCHGEHGNSTITVNPKLSAQNEAYIVKQLHDFTGAERNNPVMTTFAKAMTPDDMKNLHQALRKTKTSSNWASKFIVVVSLRKTYQHVLDAMAQAALVSLRNSHVLLDNIRIIPLLS